MSLKSRRAPLFIAPAQIQAEGPVALRIPLEGLSRHVMIAGGSGKGKSKLLEIICRQLYSLGVGFTYIDPHGDGADAVFEYLAAAEADPSRVLYHRPGAD